MSEVDGNVISEATDIGNWRLAGRRLPQERWLATGLVSEAATRSSFVLPSPLWGHRAPCRKPMGTRCDSAVQIMPYLRSSGRGWGRATLFFGTNAAWVSRLHLRVRKYREMTTGGKKQGT